MYKWSEIKKSLRKDERSGLSYSRQTDTVESWHLEFTSEQIEALDLWEEKNPRFWFSEAHNGAYEIYKRGSYNILLLPDGKVKEENKLINVYFNMENFLDNE